MSVQIGSVVVTWESILLVKWATPVFSSEPRLSRFLIWRD